MTVTTDAKARVEMLLDDRDRLRAEVARLTEEGARLRRELAARDAAAEATFWDDVRLFGFQGVAFLGVLFWMVL